MSVHRPKRFLSCRLPLVLCLLFSMTACLPVAARTRMVTQQRINELAAAVQRAHRTLIEEPGLRREGEHLEAYTARIAAPLPNEKSTQYHARVEAYVASLERAAETAGAITTVPPLRDTSADNVQLWRQAVHEAGFLPGRVAKVRAAWSECQRHQNAGALQRLGEEFARTLYVIKAVSDALRDARP